MKTKLFFDTEFTGLHQNTTLISIGIVADTGQKFYAELTNYDKSQIDGWLADNVIANLLYNDYPDSGIIISADAQQWEVKATTTSVKEQLQKWLSQFKEVEMWSDCLSYDWVLFCQIFGHAFSIPKNVYYIPFDICTQFKDNGIDPDIDRESFAEMGGGVKHNALWDAEVIRACHNKLLYISTAQQRKTNI